MTYSDGFFENLRAHTLLGTVIQLFIPASAGGLRVPIFWFNVADYEQSLGIFIENCGAHTLLGTVKQLFIPVPVH